MVYEIEITRSGPEPNTTRATVSSASEAAALVREGADTAAYVLVARHEGEVSVGEFHIWLSHRQVRPASRMACIRCRVC